MAKKYEGEHRKAESGRREWISKDGKTGAVGSAKETPTKNYRETGLGWPVGKGKCK